MQQLCQFRKYTKENRKNLEEIEIEENIRNRRNLCP